MSNQPYRSLIGNSLLYGNRVASTVTSAFNQFLKNTVNLDPNDSKSARSSRDWLVSQIHSFPMRDSAFPDLYSVKDIFFGSFARKTKKRPLDDIDIMICLNAQGAYYSETTETITITVQHSARELKKLCCEYTNLLNSRKVINKFVAALNTVPQYEKADIKRNQEAATLKLISYDWNFDIVPCFFTKPDILGKTYYLIPDGFGYWKKTDPRKDRERVQTVNQNHNGNVLNVIRILKYWNRRPTMPSMPSYLIENMILDHYETVFTGTATQYIDIEIPKVFTYLRDNIFNSVNDPKGIQGNINNLTADKKSKIWRRSNDDYTKAIEARQLEQEGHHRASINKWNIIFGSEFPDYG